MASFVHVSRPDQWAGQVFASPCSLALSSSTPTVSVGEPGDYDWLLVDYADRLYDWATYCGIPGGIPERTTIYAYMTPANTAAEINAAIAACPPGQVVYLAAGTYSLGAGHITFGAGAYGVTLRGAGAGQTIITSTTSNVINNAQIPFDGNSPYAVIAGYTKGSASITLATTPHANMVAGHLVVITEDNSVDKFGEGIGVYSRDGLTSGFYNNGSATRAHRYVSRIVSVVGNTLNLASPLPLSFSPSLNINAYPMGSCMSLCGVEGITFSGCADPIRYYGYDRCWVADCEFSGCSNGDVGWVQLNNGFQFEMRRNYLHDAAGYPNHTDGIATGQNFATFNGLFIDNIAYRTSAMFEINGTGANAYLYNYAIDTCRAVNQVACPFPMFYHHGPFTDMNLFEGNIGSGWANDGYHGSGSHAVIFRNQFHGLHSAGYTLYRRMLALQRGSYYHSVVGNVLGDASWSPYGYEAQNGDGADRGHIYILGYPNGLSTSLTPEQTWSTFTGSLPDAAVSTTLLRHGNYDYYNDATIWDEGIANHAIPSSLFYESKPAFFGSLAWPAIGPDVTGRVTAIPAKSRWDAYAVSEDIADLFADEA